MRFALLVLAIGMCHVLTSEDSRTFPSMVAWDLESHTRQCTSGLARRDRRSSGNHQRSPRPTRAAIPATKTANETYATGWDSRAAREGLRSGVHASPQETTRKKTTRQLRDVEYDHPPVVPEGNYGVLITSDGCIHCRRMYPTINTLRDQGFKVYVYNSSKYPKIKEQLNDLDPDARPIGRGAPWFIIRSGGKTTKVFRGYQTLKTLQPHMKKPDPKPVEPNYDFK